MKSRQDVERGFTLIELVVVIIILAVIAVIAAPKFLDVKRDAEISRAKAVAAAYQQSVSFVHTRWQMLGINTFTNDLPGFGNDDFDVNANGYPLGIDKGNPMGNPDNVGRGQQGCIDLWNNLLTDPPSVSRNDDGSDYQSYRHQDDNSNSGHASQCTYVLRTLGETRGRRNAEIKIQYDSVGGTAKLIIQ
ncbi:prepilin-type N-terminal cleavage/methylation domain-containing protein [Shewanella maritima]|uniref:Prepilin-type N-terminal cleavage/methylation domain-containing protein n=1 Tax=Shewanella maritima TaxID=2520507 RepID=A0A411PII1_9GAMM|nr:prepilin-type N-terminal cleavage/methylation domain-containing protein [Shewanella maritima]QBF83396.1 prepilin-type N-terminal cleavage/methylation domain-containing protein [Shewanella maritima]